jgi:hypothetical protein
MLRAANTKIASLKKRLARLDEMIAEELKAVYPAAI